MSKPEEKLDLKPPKGDELRVVSDKKGGSVPAAGGDGGLTLRYQSDLPKLPIPPLEDTCRRYLRALEGLQSKEEHQRTKQVVDEFLQKEGPALDARLRKYASTRDSYIEAFWDAAYLDTTDSVVLNLNPFFVLEDDPTPSRGNQMGRAVGLIMASLGFVHDLRTGQLEPDNMRGTPLDMYQYSRLFGTARVPTDNGCKMISDPESKHIVVLRRGQFYYFDVLDSHHRPALTERELLTNLKAICTDADKTAPQLVAKGAMGVLSTENRKLWYRLRENLRTDSDNRNCLEVVDSALFIVCLDDSSPKDINETCSNMLCGTYELDRGVQVGTCTNRWYEKLQIIVAANGTAGINFEHSGVDGHTVLRYAGDIYTDLIMRFAKSINANATTLFKAKLSPWATGAGKKAANGKTSPKEEPEELDTEPKKLEWNLTPELRTAIRFAETRLSDLICQNDIVALEFDTYGKSFITRHGFSPDAFVQMAFQAAYFSLYGRTETTYEPAMTKAFLHGRTEAIKTVQPESVAFVRAFCSDDAGPQQKMDALRTACKKHVDISRECSKGLGQDRIMYAMAALAKDPSLGAEAGADAKALKNGGSDSEDDSQGSKHPEIFRDSGYETLNHAVLSTSNCGNPCLRMFGFGAVVPDGFGIGYIIKDDAINICASSKHLQTQRFLDTLQAYLLEVQRMLTQLHREANAKPEFSSIKDEEDEDGLDAFGGYGFYTNSFGAIDKLLGQERRTRGRSVGTKIAMGDY